MGTQQGTHTWGGGIATRRMGPHVFKEDCISITIFQGEDLASLYVTKPRATKSAAQPPLIYLARMIKYVNVPALGNKYPLSNILACT